jgi:RNA polymerase sigma factor (sigma-70 family)
MLSPRELKRCPSPAGIEAAACELLEFVMHSIAAPEARRPQLRDVILDVIRGYLCSANAAIMEFDDDATGDDLRQAVLGTARSRWFWILRGKADCDTRFHVYRHGRQQRTVTIERASQWDSSAIRPLTERPNTIERNSVPLNEAIDSPIDTHDRVELARDVRRAIDGLDDPRQVIILENSLSRALTETELGQCLGLSQGRVSQIKRAALWRLRTILS